MTEQQHPLTDEICDSIAPWPIKRPSEYDCMRTAAEWQLIQVVSYLDDYNDPTWDVLLTDKFQTLINDLKKAMRPQQQEEQ